MIFLQAIPEDVRHFFGIVLERGVDNCRFFAFSRFTAEHIVEINIFPDIFPD
ncbi:hypothetical protein D3C73_1452980 [compost metagenome]